MTISTEIAGDRGEQGSQPPSAAGRTMTHSAGIAAALGCGVTP